MSSLTGCCWALLFLVVVWGAIVYIVHLIAGVLL
jgi:predicted metal-binding membrane protein